MIYIASPYTHAFQRWLGVPRDSTDREQMALAVLHIETFLKSNTVKAMGMRRE